jgi:hypothetical protein
VTSAANFLGLLFGVQHAVEPDHLAAVSTLASEQRNPRAALALGALWGVGHTFSLLLVGGTLAALGAPMPEVVAEGLEFLVAVMVVGLGVRAVLRAWREGQAAGTPHVHSHGGVPHVHATEVPHVHVFTWTLASRPLLVGLVHGLAGSGALTALVLTQLPDTPSRLLYIALFGLGSIVGMAALTGLFGVPLGRLAHAPRAAAALTGFTGVLSILIGGAWGLQSGLSFLQRL